MMVYCSDGTLVGLGGTTTVNNNLKPADYRRWPITLAAAVRPQSDERIF